MKRWPLVTSAPFSWPFSWISQGDRWREGKCSKGCYSIFTIVTGGSSSQLGWSSSGHFVPNCLYQHILCQAVSISSHYFFKMELCLYVCGSYIDRKEVHFVGL